MTTDVGAPIAISHAAVMGELMSAHLSLLDRTMFKTTVVWGDNIHARLLIQRVNRYIALR
jgi:hypothetical protein